MKQAILATVVSVKKQSSDSVAVRLESRELNDATVIVSTGLDCERTRIKRPGCRLDVTCKGDPRAKVGDTVPVIVESVAAEHSEPFQRECVKSAVTALEGHKIKLRHGESQAEPGKRID